MFDRNKQKNDGPSKSFLTAGPILHYSHPNAHRYWWLTVALYLCVCLFWSKMLTGNLDSLQLQSVHDFNIWSLGYYATGPVNIFEYPWQILVLGLLMAILSFVPILISQLLSSRYCVLLILMAAFIAKLPGLALFLTVSCVAVACRPLRFRSRFISIVLCSSPLMIYWGIFGGTANIDPVKWGLSYTPWLTAWICGLAICGVVLGIGHYTRYKPGATSLVMAVAFAIAGFTFFDKISFAESDYQIYVVRNSPDESTEFHSRSITSVIDRAADNPLLNKDIFLTFSTSKKDDSEKREVVRSRLLDELEAMANIVWPLWFTEQADSDIYDFESKRNARIEELNYFISHHRKSKRMPIALYYKAMLREYLPNVKSLREKEILEFYNDHPRLEVFPDWVLLYRDYPESPESLEARWRIAINLCRKGDFETAVSLCREAIAKAEKFKNTLPTETDNDGAAFSLPAWTVITERKLNDVYFHLRSLVEFLDNNDVQSDEGFKSRLAAFIGMNRYDPEYNKQLEHLLSISPDNDPLRDNIQLASILTISNPEERKKVLGEFITANKHNDSVIQASYELGLSTVQIWRQFPEESPQRAALLNDARTILNNVIKNYPQSVYSIEAGKKLNALPRQELPAN